MKKPILIAIILCISLLSKAQDFGGFEHILDMPPDSLIATKTFLTEPSVPLSEKLNSISALPKGGLIIKYQRSYGNTSIAPSYTIYYYTKNNQCFAVKEVLSLDENGDRIKHVMTEFNAVNDHTLFAKNENLKLVHYSDLKNNTSVFIYTRKKTIMPVYKE